MMMMKRYEIQQIEVLNDNYPRRLSSISNPPVRLYYIGDINTINQRKSVAVIGSRCVSGPGIEIAYWVGYELGRRGINVVNGLALGCDTHALRGALAAGGTCVAVMPCGLEQTVPRSNSGLADKMLSNGGCLISAYPVGTPIRRYQYVERDRLQSGISEGVIMVEAECGSGTIHTVLHAIKQGRRVACIDSQIMRYASGNRWLEKQSKVRAIRDVVDLNNFVSDIQSDTVYTQVRFDLSVIKG